MQTTLAQFNENQSGDRFSLQSTRMLRILLAEGPVRVRRRAIVASQGPVSFAAASEPGVDLVVVEGGGELFLGERAQDIHLVALEGGESITAGGHHLLAFTSALECETAPVEGGEGLVNARLTGTGWVALTSDGPPVLLAVSERGTVAHAHAVIAWSDQAQPAPAADDPGAGARLAFGGQGWVLVQPSAG